MLNEIKQFLIKIFWPLIREFIKNVLKEFLAWLLKKVKEIFEQRNKKNEEKATSNAEAAEEQARNAKTAEEAEKHAAVAKVWREVAESLRQENEDLKQQLDELKREAAKNAESAVETMRFEDHFDTSGKELKVIENRPALRLEEKSGG